MSLGGSLAEKGPCWGMHTGTHWQNHSEGAGSQSPAGSWVEVMVASCKEAL